MNKTKPVLMWVHPNFKITLKKKAAELNMPIERLTKELSGIEDIHEYFKNNKRFKL
jgi:hypothetical protein